MKINDNDLLVKMKSIIFHDGDVRPVWVGPKLADTDVLEFKNYSKWANEHWGLYKAFISDMRDDSTILDLGCGVGFCTINLSDVFKNSKIYGYDIDSVSTNFGIEYNSNENIKYLCEDIINNKLIKSDFIFLVETLEHIKHQYHYTLIDNCLEALNNDGLLFISTPNEQTFVDGDRGHVGILTNEFFIKFKERYHDKIVSIEYYENTKLLDDNCDNYINKNDGSHFKIILKK
jgi:SAM-dependent methyltransferase